MEQYARHGEPRVSIVISALDAEMNVYFLLRHLPDVHEVVLVDGGSTDGTPETARQARPDVRIVHRAGSGRAGALAVGIGVATGDIIVTVPADGSADPAEIPRFVAALVDGADVVKGSRYVDGGSAVAQAPGQAAGDRMLAWLGDRLLGTGLSDLGYGYYAFWADQRHLLGLGGETDGPWTDEIDVAVACRLTEAGARVVEIPSTQRVPLVGSTRRRGAFLRGARTVLAERRRRTGPGREVRFVERSLV